MFGVYRYGEGVLSVLSAATDHNNVEMVKLVLDAGFDDKKVMYKFAQVSIESKQKTTKTETTYIVKQTYIAARTCSSPARARCRGGRGGGRRAKGATRMRFSSTCNRGPRASRGEERGWIWERSHRKGTAGRRTRRSRNSRLRFARSLQCSRERGRDTSSERQSLPGGCREG